MIQNSVPQYPDRTRMKRVTAIFFFLVAVAVSTLSYVQMRSVNAVQRHIDSAYTDIERQNGPAAEQQWIEALKLDPGNRSVLSLLAQYYMDTHQWSKGVDEFLIIKKLDPSSKETDDQLAACYLRMGDQQKAFQLAKEAVKADPNSVAALGIVTTIMTRQTGVNQDKLLVYLKHFAELQPRDLLVQHMYAEALANRYLYPELRAELAHLLEIDPEDAEAYNLKGYTDLARTDQPAGARQALADFQTSESITPNNGGAYFGMGRAYLHLNRPNHAVAMLKQADKLDPHQIRIMDTLARAYRLAGKSELADKTQSICVLLERTAAHERTLEVECAEYPQNSQYPLELGKLYIHMGRYHRAEYYLAKADQLHPGDRTLHEVVVRLKAGLSPVAGNNYLQ